MEITIIISLATIWLTMLGFIFTIVNGQRELRKDLEQKIKESSDSIKEEIKGIKEEIRDIRKEIRDIRKEIASFI